MEWIVGKTDFPDGPWKSEPDRIEWRDEETGLVCLVVRVPRIGHLCGYVGVGPGHPDYERSYEDSDLNDIDVHGGLTFAGGCRGPVYHESASGEPALWWFGFDSAHIGDLLPAYHKNERGTYKDVSYMRAECARLAKQLHERRA